MASDPHSYYLTDHYVSYPVVLVRLSRIDVEGLRELLAASWRFVSAKKPKIKPIVRLAVFVLFASAAGQVGAAQNKLEPSDRLIADAPRSGQSSQSSALANTERQYKYSMLAIFASGDGQ